MTRLRSEARSPAHWVHDHTPHSLDTRANANWVDLGIASLDFSGLSHPATLFRRAWEGPSHKTGAPHTHRQKTTRVALQTLSGLANWVGGVGEWCRELLCLSCISHPCLGTVPGAGEQTFSRPLSHRTPSPTTKPLLQTEPSLPQVQQVQSIADTQPPPPPPMRKWRLKGQRYSTRRHGG